MKRLGQFFLLCATVGLLALAPAVPALQTGLQQRSIPLTALGMEPYAALQGPYGEVTLHFTTPANWQPELGSNLTLDLQSFFSSYIPAQGELPTQNLVAGHLSVLLDDTVLYRNVLSANGEQQLSLPLEPSRLAQGAQHSLRIYWDASASCALNLSSTALLQPSSSLNLSYSETAVTPDLGRLPYPYFSADALEQPGTLILIPSNPSEAQVAAGLRAAAGLGRFAPAQAITLRQESEVSAAELSEHHLIFVGPLEAFNQLDTLTLPHNQDANLRLPVSQRTELGFIEVSRSPWNLQRSLLVVSGGSDAAVNRAALALGGPLVLNRERTLALIGEEQFTATPRTDRLSSTLADLGHNDFTFTRFGRSELRVPFYVSPDRAISDAAFIDLRFAHSQLLDYLRSSVSLSINGQLLSTTRLVDQTAARHSEVTLLPPSVLKPGVNELVVSADVVPLDLCADPQQGEHWLTIYADSALQLPNAEEPATKHEASLGDFPLPFLQDGMQATTLLLPAQDSATWSSAAELLRGLAATYQVWPLQAQVQIGSSSSAFASLQNDHVILLGNFDDFLSDLEMQSVFGVERDGTRGTLLLSDGNRLSYSANVPLAAASLGRLPDSKTTSKLALLSNAPDSLNSLVRLVTQPAFSEQTNGVLLLAQQGSTLIKDSRALAPMVPSATSVSAEMATAPLAAASNQGLWLWPLLALLLVAFGLLVWTQLAHWLQVQRRGKPPQG
ncbi:MAG: cellulose biosynthesis cyclic di-GMP-binding regulatory protein BcsB [Anaerolineales bacterium]|nr:cellulose biosynthesis cyclic di-GMP-binding regulatory protein BcsB [Anaerolineales bacterium]